MPTVDGLYYEVLDGSAGAATVLLSPGLGGSAHFWAPQIEAFQRRFNVLLYDHRGTGRSARTLTKPHSVDAMAHDIKAVLDAAGVAHAHVIGHAAGANAGLALARLAPERVTSLVAINGWSRPDPHIGRCFETRLALLRQAGRRAFVRAQPIFLYPAEWISQNTARLEAEETHLIEGLPPDDIVISRIEALLDFDIDADLQHIAAPVLVIASADDMLVPTHCSRRLAGRLPRATLDIMPWGGHAMSVTDPEDFNSRLLQFLDSI